MIKRRSIQPRGVGQVVNGPAPQPKFFCKPLLQVIEVLHRYSIGHASFVRQSIIQALLPPGVALWDQSNVKVVCNQNIRCHHCHASIGSLQTAQQLSEILATPRM
jgi:hypothetical protein